MRRCCIIVRVGITVLCVFGALTVFGQSDSTKLFPWKLHFQTRYSLADGQLLAVWGGSVGYVWGPYEREITLGYHWLGGRGSRQLGKFEKNTAQAAGLDRYNSTDAGFVNVGYWHIMHNSRRWKFGIPIELGLGKAIARPYSLSDELLSVPSLTSPILPLQVAGYGEWKATRWVGVGLQAGYRQNLIRFLPVDRLNGPYGRLRILVYPTTYVDWLRFIFKGKPLPSPFYKKEKSTL